MSVGEVLQSPLRDKVSYYKFTNLAYIDILLRGHLHFASLTYFRLMEIAAGDSFIGDRHEGLHTDNIENCVYEPHVERSPLQKSLENGIAFISENAAAELNIVVNRFIDGYVFCFSYGAISELSAAMHNGDISEEPYDACIKIIDPVALAVLIRDQGEIDGTPIADDFDVQIGYVNYVNPIDKIPERLGSPNPFHKRANYSLQKEVRIFLKPKNARFLRPTGFVRSDFIDVELSNVGHLLVEEFRRPQTNRTSKKQSASPLLNHEDCWTILKALRKSPSSSVGCDTPRDVIDQRFAEIRQEWASLQAPLAKIYWALRKTYPFYRMDQAVMFERIQHFDIIDYLWKYQVESGNPARFGCDYPD